MKDRFPPRALPRGRVAQWSREQLAALTTPELRQLLANAKRLNEDELAATCDQLLGERPNGHPRAPRVRKPVAGDAQ